MEGVGGWLCGVEQRGDYYLVSTSELQDAAADDLRVSSMRREDVEQMYENKKEAVVDQRCNHVRELAHMYTKRLVHLRKDICGLWKGMRSGVHVGT